MLHAPHMLYSKLMLLTRQWCWLGFCSQIWNQNIAIIQKIDRDTNLQFQRRSNAVPCNSLQPHHEKMLINSLCARCLFCLLPNHLADFPEKYEKLFTKILERLVLYKRISGKEADTAKQEYSSFLRIVMKIGW